MGADAGESMAAGVILPTVSEYAKAVGQVSELRECLAKAIGARDAALTELAGARAAYAAVAEDCDEALRCMNSAINEACKLTITLGEAREQRDSAIQQRDAAIAYRDSLAAECDEYKRHSIDVATQLLEQANHRFIEISEAYDDKTSQLIDDLAKAYSERDAANVHLEQATEIRDHLAIVDFEMMEEQRDAALAHIKILSDTTDNAQLSLNKVRAELEEAYIELTRSSLKHLKTEEELELLRATSHIVTVERDQAIKYRDGFSKAITETSGELKAALSQRDDAIKARDGALVRANALEQSRRRFQSERDTAIYNYMKAVNERNGHRLEHCAIAQHRDAILKERDELIGELDDAIENIDIEKDRFHGLEFSIGVIAGIVGLVYLCAIYFGVMHREVQPTPLPEPAAVELMSSYIPGYPITCADVSQHLFVEAEFVGGSMFECRAPSDKWTVMLHSGSTRMPPGEQLAIPSEDK